jgi:ribosome recycling factor
MVKPQEVEERLNNTIDHFEQELRKLHVGRPSPDMFASIEVDAYGAKNKLEALASINIVDATLVTVQPWDKTLIDNIEKGLQAADMGFNPQIDGDLIRIPIPPLTNEKREEMVKELGKMTEEHKIQIRVTRKEVMNYLSNEEKQGNITEDQRNAQEKRLQEKVDEANDKIEELAKSKEEALLKV